MTVVDDGDSLAVEEEGTVPLVVGVVEYAVLFTTQKLNANYDFFETDIDNTVDASPLSIGFEMTERTIDGFTLILDALPDTVNYRFNWLCRINTV